MPRINARGQESAPFELLVAVIVMTFVIIMGATAMDRLAREKSIGEIDAAMRDIQLAIEDVVNGTSPQRTVDFDLPGYFKKKDSYMRLQVKQSQKTCSRYCPGAVNICTLLVFSSPDVTPIYKCVRISYLTQFTTDPDECAGDYEDEGYTLIDLQDTGREQPIPEGKYIIMTARGQESFPKVCAYVKPARPSDIGG